MRLPDHIKPTYRGFEVGKVATGVKINSYFYFRGVVRAIAGHDQLKSIQQIIYRGVDCRTKTPNNVYIHDPVSNLTHTPSVDS